MKILETYRDAIQGLDWFVPTAGKVSMIQALMSVGFDYLDIGSFVSDKQIPQFGDMKEVMAQIDKGSTGTKVCVLAANEKGAEKALSYENIDCIIYPFSTSETFLKKNINKSFEESWSAIRNIQDACMRQNKKMIVYLAMAFGNPYGDPVDVELCLKWTEKFFLASISNIHLSDVTGVSTAAQIRDYYSMLIHAFPAVEFGIHLHVKPNDWFDKIDAAAKNGCHVFDGVISGLGGCPMTGYEMLANLPTKNLVTYAMEQGQELKLDLDVFQQTISIISSGLDGP